MVVPGLVQRRRFLPRPFPGNAIDWSSSALASDIKSCGLTLKQLGSCAGVARSELGLPSRSTALLLEPGRRGFDLPSCTRVRDDSIAHCFRERT